MNSETKLVLQGCGVQLIVGYQNARRTDAFQDQGIHI